MREKILITGITGFVGSHLADYVLGKGGNYEVYGVKRWHLSRMDNCRHFMEKIKWVDCNLHDPIGTQDMIKEVKPDRVFHCAAESFVSPSWKHPNSYMQTNYNGTVNLLDALHRIGSKAPFHIPGSGEEFGEIYEHEVPIHEETIIRPVNPYAVSKVAQDLIGYVYHKSYGMNVIRTRAFNHEGPRRDKVFGIPWYAYQVARIEAGKQEPMMRVGFLDDRRNFTHVRDMVEAYWISTEKCKAGELYLIGSDEEDKVYTFRQALESLIAMSNVKGIKYQTVPEYVRPTQVPRLIGTTKKFREATGWTPKISYETILTETLEYWRHQVKAGLA